MKTKYSVITSSRLPENIGQFQDFDAIIDSLPETKNTNSNLKYFVAATGVIALATILLWLMNSEEPPQPLDPGVRTVSPILPESAPVEQNEPAAPAEEPKAIPAKDREKPDEPTDQKVEDSNVVKIQAEISYIKATPLDGVNELYDYFHNELQYPTGEDVSGISVATFTISATGGVTDITIDKSLGERFDKEVIRLLENMPAWTPATMNGVPVESKISLPFTFEAK